jgi:hypothetical protein
MTGIGQRRVLAGLSTIGAIEGEPPDVAIRKQTLVLSAALITALARVWVVTYAALGLFLAAAIPFTYRSVSIANLLVFARTKRYRFFRASELSLLLVLPFVLQMTLGGFFPSSGVVL